MRTDLSPFSNEAFLTADVRGEETDMDARGPCAAIKATVAPVGMRPAINHAGAGAA